MNYLKKITFSIATLTFIFALQSVIAQDIDSNRMERDINIMENILQEMFKTSWATHGNTVRVHYGSFSSSRSDDVRGTYIQDFGVIFTIPGGPPAFVMRSDSDGKESSYRFRYGDSKEGEPVTRETITYKIVEFLQDYGPTIGQLSDDDKVMVIYKSNNPDQELIIFRSASDDEQEKAKRQQLPTISIAATKSNLQAYRSGDISSEDFRNRLDISSVKASSANQKDLRLMAGIFETAFEETEEKSFRIRGSVDYLHLSNFGALFSFNARYSTQGDWIFSKLTESLKTMGKELKEARADLREKITTSSESLRSEKLKQHEQNRKEQKQETINAYEQFLGDLKEYIVDYGRTLSSINSNQQIFISVSLSSRYEEIPERIGLQIQKSTLENMNPEQAIDEINVREY